MPTIRNARGSDLFVTNGDETIFFGVQSKRLGKRDAVGLGKRIDDLRSDWWIITIRANSDSPVCYILRLEEVHQLAKQDARKERKWWLGSPAYDRDEYREAWERIGTLQASGSRATDART